MTLSTAFAPRRTPTIPASLASRIELVEAAAWSDLAAAASPSAIRSLGLTAVPLGSATLLAAATSDVLALNRAIGLGSHEAATDADLDATVRFFDSAGPARCFVSVSPLARPLFIGDRLVARGFRYRNNWIKLIRTTKRRPAPQSALLIDVLAPDHAETFGRMVSPAFDWPVAMGDVLTRTVGRSGWHHYAAYDGGDVVAVAAMFIAGDTAWFGPAVTRASHRGRGAQSALIARRLHDAASLGVQYAVAETAEERPERPVVQSYRNLRRVGFEVAYRRPNYLLER